MSLPAPLLEHAEGVRTRSGQRRMGGRLPGLEMRSRRDAACKGAHPGGSPPQGTQQEGGSLPDAAVLCSGTMLGSQHTWPCSELTPGAFGLSEKRGHSASSSEDQVGASRERGMGERECVCAKEHGVTYKNTSGLSPPFLAKLQTSLEFPE